MKHIKLINEYLNPILPISKDELGMGIKPDDKLIINSELYYFWYFDDEKNEIHAIDESGEDHIFNLDELNDTWELSKINDHEIVVESKK